MWYVIGLLCKRNNELRNKIALKNQAFTTVSSFIWDHALFMDNKGRAGHDRDVEQTTLKWEKFNIACKAFYDL